MKIIELNLSFKSMSKRSRTTRIILHHAEASTCTVQDVHRWHRNKGWSGIGYHFFVRKNGSVYRGRPENTVGAHASGSNSDSVGVCFEGAYMTETMPAAQKTAGKELIAYLKGQYGISKVQAHRDVCATSCPGANFPFAEIIGGSGNVVTPKPSTNTDNKTVLRIDGWWGPKLTTRLQQILGTTVDGMVSNQFSCYENANPGLDGGWEWLVNPSGHSPLIKAIQKKIGAKEDGRIGPDTVRGIQKWFGCAQDGCFSGPSPSIKKLQEWCNKQ